MEDKNIQESLSEKEFDEISSLEPKMSDTVKLVENESTDKVVSSRSETAPDGSTDTKRTYEHPVNEEIGELEPQMSSGTSDNYFDDDEEFLRGDDLVVHENSDIALFKQEDNVVSWEIVNFYKDDSTPRGKLALRNDPPIMKISSSSGDTAEFLVTKEFSKSLGKILEDVNRAYYGIAPTKKSEKLSQEVVKNKFRSLGQWIWDHKLKSAVAVVVTALLAIALLT